MSYVDGFIVPVPRDRMEEYRRIAADMAEVWMDHGALGVTEAKADDVPYGERTSFPRAVGAEKDGAETVVFSFIRFRDRAHRDEVNGKVMADPRLAGFDMKTAPFDGARMIFGGFEIIVEK